MARPTKFTPERAERILASLKAGNTRRCACGVARIDETSFYRWMRRYAGFASDVARAEAEAEAAFAAIIHHAAVAGDWRAAESWLKRRRREEWGDSLDVRRLPDDRLIGLLNLACGDRPTTSDNAQSVL